MSRYGKMNLVIGQRESGKSNDILTKLYKSVQTHNRKALIVDYKNEYESYIYRKDQPAHSIKAIYHNSIPRFSAQIPAEIVRVAPFDDKTRKPLFNKKEKQAGLFKVLTTYHDGSLLVEDPNSYMGDVLPDDFVATLSTLRQSGVDIILPFQLLQKANHPKLIGMANYIILHKTKGQVSQFDWGAYNEIMSLSEIIVGKRFSYGMKNDINNETGKFFSVTLDLDYQKIRGIFTKKEALQAIEIYLGRQNGSAVRQELSRVDKLGKRIWSDYGNAYNYLEETMLQEYFDFK